MQKLPQDFMGHCTCFIHVDAVAINPSDLTL